MRKNTYKSKLYSVKVDGIFLPPFACPTKGDACKFFIDLCGSLIKSCSLWYVGDFNGKTGDISTVKPVKVAEKKKGKPNE